MQPFKDQAVAIHFEQYPAQFKEPLVQVRELIFETAAKVSPEESLSESLKWNQPSYTSKGASPIRIDRFGEDKIALLFHCQTTLVATFREMFPEILEFSKNRGIILDANKALPVNELSFCIQMALTYHRK